MTTATQTDTDPTRRRADVHAAIRALRPGLADISDHDELHGLGGCSGRNWSAGAARRSPNASTSTPPPCSTA